MGQSHACLGRCVRVLIFACSLSIVVSEDDGGALRLNCDFGIADYPGPQHHGIVLLAIP